MSNLPIKKNENSIFYKIRMFLLKIIGKNVSIENHTIKETEPIKNDFVNNLQSSIKSQKLEQDILKAIEENSELLYNLPDEKLEQLIRNL